MRQGFFPARTPSLSTSGLRHRVTDRVHDPRRLTALGDLHRVEERRRMHQGLAMERRPPLLLFAYKKLQYFANS